MGGLESEDPYLDIVVKTISSLNSCHHYTLSLTAYSFYSLCWGLYFLTNKHFCISHNQKNVITYINKYLKISTNFLSLKTRIFHFYKNIINKMKWMKTKKEMWKKHSMFQSSRRFCMLLLGCTLGERHTFPR
jgi:hypothetical protein